MEITEACNVLFHKLDAFSTVKTPEPVMILALECFKFCIDGLVLGMFINPLNTKVILFKTVY